MWVKKFNKFNESKTVKTSMLNLEKSDSLKWLEDVVSLLEDLEISELELHRSFTILNMSRSEEPSSVEYTTTSDSMIMIDGFICGDPDFDFKIKNPKRNYKLYKSILINFVVDMMGTVGHSFVPRSEISESSRVIENKLKLFRSLERISSLDDRILISIQSSDEYVDTVSNDIDIIIVFT